jgi:linoleoyl-CoA desaturase
MSGKDGGLASARAANRLSFAPPSAFARALQCRVNSDFAGADRDRFADAGQWGVAAAFFAAGVAAYGAMLFGGVGVVATALLAAAASLCALMLIFILGHEAAHGAISPRRWVNESLVFAIFAVLGVSGALWRDRHVRLHHRFANLPGTGIDTDGSAVLRLSPHKMWHRLHALQPFYAGFLYVVVLLHLAWIEDALHLLAARRHSPAGFGSGRSLAAFAATKLLHVTLFLIVPAMVLRPSPAGLLAAYVFATGVVSVIFIVLQVGTHVSDLAAFPMPDAEGRVAHDWATHQLLTSVDWLPTSRLATRLLGGANAHVAHHLFPGHSHRHAARLSRLIVETAAAHGLPHRVVTLRGMVLGHLRHLVALSRPPQCLTPAACPRR